MMISTIYRYYDHFMIIDIGADLKRFINYEMK